MQPPGKGQGPPPAAGEGLTAPLLAGSTSRSSNSGSNSGSGNQPASPPSMPPPLPPPPPPPALSLVGGRSSSPSPSPSPLVSQLWASTEGPRRQPSPPPPPPMPSSSSSSLMPGANGNGNGNGGGGVMGGLHASTTSTTTTTNASSFYGAMAAGNTSSSSSHRPHRRGQSWEFPGWGGALCEMDFEVGGDGEQQSAQQSGYAAYRAALAAEQKNPPVELGELPATAICGCDIMASVLYTTGLVASRAGKLAPVCMLCVAFVLHLFRYVYSEAVCSLPLNGGSYNILLNATTKGLAAICACLSVLSYLATGVVSAISATSYLQLVWTGLSLQGGGICLLAIFALLVFMGLSESAGVASVLFLAHMAVLTGLLLLGAVYACSNTHQFVANMQAPFPDVRIVDSVREGTLLTALFYGYSSAMLGVTGFETSANFVEEQKPGVYPKTLRNMWLGVAVYNPLLVLLALFCFPLDFIAERQNSIIAHMAQRMGDWLGPVRAGHSLSWGTVLQNVVAIDAFLVLAGSVLTSYVGLGGLLRRLALDRCFPQVVLQTNSWRGTHHIIIFGFFVVATSLIMILDGSVEALAGVYTMAFLSVMGFFAAGTLVLRVKRPELQRPFICPLWMVVVGLACVFVAFIGNVMDNAEVVPYFVCYYAVMLALCFAMFQRVRVLKLLVFGLQSPEEDEEEEEKEEEQREQQEGAGTESASSAVAVAAPSDGSSSTGGGGARNRGKRRPRPSAGAGAVAGAADGDEDDEVQRERRQPLLPSGGGVSGGGGANGSSSSSSTTEPSQQSQQQQQQQVSQQSHRPRRGRRWGWRWRHCQRRLWARVRARSVGLIKAIQEEPFLFLAKHPDPSLINKALLYVRDNEQTSRILVVHFYTEREREDAEDPTFAYEAVRRDFEASVQVIDKIYPKIMVNCLLVRGRFFPEALERLSFETGVPKHRMFMACPSNLADFHLYSGVRIITH